VRSLEEQDMNFVFRANLGARQEICASFDLWVKINITFNLPPSTLCNRFALSTIHPPTTENISNFYSFLQQLLTTTTTT